MTTPNVRNVLRVAGNLVADPTNLSTAFPHGGTALGLVRDTVFRLGAKTHVISAEEFGGVAVDAVYSGEFAVFAAVLRELDNDAIQKVFVNTAAGAGSGNRVIKHEPGAAGTIRPGTLLSTKSMKLLFSPKALNEHPGILIYKAIPAIEDAAELQLHVGSEAGVAVVFYCLPDATGRVYQVGRMEDLAL